MSNTTTRLATCLGWLILLWLSPVLAGRVVPPDPFERDNAPFLGEYTILEDGIVQEHWFHTASDADWYLVNVYLGEDNVIALEEQVPIRGTGVLRLNVRVFSAEDFCFFPSIIPGICENTPLIERNPCFRGGPVGDPVTPINLNGRLGLVATAVYVVVRDCNGVASDENTYTIEVLDRGFPPPPGVPRFLAAKLSGTVTRAGSGDPVGSVILADGVIVGFSNPLSGIFNLLLDPGTETVSLSADAETLITQSVAPDPIGPVLESENVTGISIVVGPGDGVFVAGFE